jgi:DNA-binding NarL/FixJ family response regulator
VAEAADVEQPVRRELAYKPLVVVLDLRTPGGSGLEAIPRTLGHPRRRR